MQKASEPRPLPVGSTSGQRDGRGQRRVDRVAALRQHRQPGLRGERLRGGDDVVGHHGERREG
jgi:hypothetical protein